MIAVDQQNQVFTLHTRRTTYQMKVDGRYQVLLHTYYGPRVRGGDLSYLIRGADRGFSPGSSRRWSARTASSTGSTRTGCWARRGGP